MSTLVSRGFGVSQRLISRGFFSAAAPLAQKIGTVIASFAESGITAEFKPDSVTTEFKPNTVTVKFKD